jgi:hypothetical protein
MPNKKMVMSGSCLNNVRNYSNRSNSVAIPNNNTASFTYDLCVPDNQKLIMLDMSELIPGVSITTVDSTVQDASGNSVVYSGVPNFVFDVSTLDDSQTWRIDYTITTDTADTDTARVFFDAFDDSDTRGTSDPNRCPLREKNDSTATGTTDAVCFMHTQVVPATTWVVAHNTGKSQPCGTHILNAAGTSQMMGSVVPLDANTANVFFSIPLAGTIKLTF